MTFSLEERKIVDNLESKNVLFSTRIDFQRKIKSHLEIEDSNFIENDLIERLEKESDQKLQKAGRIMLHKIHTFSHFSPKI